MLLVSFGWGEWDDWRGDVLHLLSIVCAVACFLPSPRTSVFDCSPALPLCVCLHCLVFAGAAQFNRTLCGFHWINSVAARSVGLTTAGQEPCYCPSGTYYNKVYTGVCDNPPCLPCYEEDGDCILYVGCDICSAGAYSFGGDASTTACEQACDNLEWGYYCVQGVKTQCLKAYGIACVGGNIVSSLELLNVPTDPVELRESEVGVNNGQHEYSLSLSSQPTHPVTVHISATRSGGYVDCVNQPDRFMLLTSSLVFSAENYSEPQIVATQIKVSVAYQGPMGIVFSHRLVGDGFVWEALPVSVAILDDGACTPGAAQHEDNNNVRICQCEEGYFINSTDPNFCGSATCMPCAEGMICNGKAEDAAMYRNQELESVLIKPGMYRVNAESAVVVSCPLDSDSACVGGATAGDLLCATGHTGPMCQICLVTGEVTYVKSDDECVPCEPSHQGIIYGLLAAVLVVMAMAAYFIMRHTDKAEEVALELDSKHKRLSRQILTKYKIVLKLLQTLSKITTLYPEIAFPAVFTRLVSKFNIFVDLDVNTLPFNCVASANFHDKLIAMTVFPMVCIAYIGLVFVCQRRKIKARYTSRKKIREKLGKLEADCIYYTLVFVYTIFSLVSTTIIQTFKYDDRLEIVTGESYLIVDYTIKESDPVHRAYVAYAAVMFVLYCVGIPVASLYLLGTYKPEIEELQLCVYELAAKEEEARKLGVVMPSLARLSGVQEDSMREGFSVSDLFADISELPAASTTLEADINTLRTKQKDILEKSPRLRGLTPLYQDYEAGYYYFEVVQFAVTLLLVAVVVLPFLASS
jgi:hypothetical protein